MNRKDRTAGKKLDLNSVHLDQKSSLDPEFYEIMDAFVYGDVYQQGCIDDELRQLIALVVLTAIHEHDQLQHHVQVALHLQVSPLKIKEAIYQCAPFTGYPRVISALNVVNHALHAAGIRLPLTGQQTVPEEQRYERGKELQYPIYGDRIHEAMRLLPAEQREKIPQFLTENCFGDFYTRAGLEVKTRELLILCVLCALGGCEAQIRSHTAGNLKVGSTHEEIVSAITHCIPFVGFSRVINALNIIKEVPAP